MGFPSASYRNPCPFEPDSQLMLHLYHIIWYKTSRSGLLDTVATECYSYYTNYDIGV